MKIIFTRLLESFLNCCNIFFFLADIMKAILVLFVALTLCVLHIESTKFVPRHRYPPHRYENLDERNELVNELESLLVLRKLSDEKYID